MKAVLCILIVTFPFFVEAANDTSKGSVQATKPALSVNVTKPTQQNINQQVIANGSLAAWQEAIISAEANGLKITEVRVNVGDRVKQGDVIAVLQSDIVRAELAQVEGSLAEAIANA